MSAGGRSKWKSDFFTFTPRRAGFTVRRAADYPLSRGFRPAPAQQQHDDDQGDRAETGRDERRRAAQDLLGPAQLLELAALFRRGEIRRRADVAGGAETPGPGQIRTVGDVAPVVA